MAKGGRRKVRMEPSTETVGGRVGGVHPLIHGGRSTTVGTSAENWITLHGTFVLI